jgi:hypothetical protein
MGFRFRRTIRLLPGVRLNIGKSGASVSVGGRGASVNISKRGVYGTAGIPGTGMSVRERLDEPKPVAPQPTSRSWVMAVVVLAAVVWGLVLAM